MRAIVKQIRIWRLLLIGGLIAIPLTARAGPEMSYGLALDGDLWGSAFSSSFDFDNEFSLSRMHLNLSGPRLQAQAGDVSANWDQLAIAGRSFQGLSTGIAVGKVDLSLLGGTVVLQPDYLDRRFDDLLAEIPEPVTSPIYGVRAALPLGNKFNLSASQLIAPNAPAKQGKEISTLALNYQHSARRNVAFEIARSKQGSGWQLSGATQGRRLKLQASYRETSLGFSTAGNPTLLRRRNGGFVNMDYRLAKSLTLKANLQRYNDGREGNTNYDTLELRYAKRKQPSVSVFWRSAQSHRPSIFGSQNAPDIDISSSGMGVRLGYQLGVNRVSAQIERLQFRSSSALVTDNTSNRFSLGLSRPLGKQTQLSFYQILDLGTTNRTSYTSLNLRRRFGKSGLSTDLGLQYVNRNETGISGQATYARAGFRYNFRSNSSIGLEYQTTLFGSGSLGARSADRLYIGYSHSFYSGSGRNRNLSLQERRLLGRVSGRVFEDINVNGQWDDGEPGVPDVTINLVGGLQQQTDSNGRFSVVDVRPGDYLFALKMKTLPIEYTTLTTGDVPLQVIADKSVTLDIPVVRTGIVQGVVFQDTNRNGIRDAGEPGVANALVKVLESDIISFTDHDGHFTLHDLAPKKWRVTVDIAVLGEDMERTGSGFAEVLVPHGGTVAGIALGVAPVQKVIVDTPFS